MRRRGWAWFLAVSVVAPASACGLLSDIPDPQLVGGDGSADSAVDGTALDAQETSRADLGPEVDASRGDSALDVGDSPSPDTHPDSADADVPADARDGDGSSTDSSVTDTSGIDTGGTDTEVGETTVVDAGPDTAEANSDAPDSAVTDADTAEACVAVTTSCPSSYCGTITDECGHTVSDPPPLSWTV
ncbi:MAG: hypothetical protein NVSMB47_12250 [Polyangiales bacterium]